MKRVVSLLLAVLVPAASCGGGTHVVNEPMAPLPPEPATGPAPPPPPAAPPEPEKDPWAGRTDLVQPPAPAPAAKVNLPAVTRFKLPNGLQVLVVASPDLPVVNMQLAVGAGEQDEPRDRRLLASYAASMLTRGTAKRSADDIAHTMDFIGGSLGAGADLETTHVTCSALARDLATCLTLLPEVVTTPTFPTEEMKEVADQLIAGLKQAHDNPAALAHEHAENALWGDDHVRGWPRTAEGVAAITRDDLVAWHKARFTPGNSLLAVAGDVDVNRLKAELTRGFAPWKARPAKKTAVYREPRPAGLKIRLVDKPDQTQSQIVVASLGVAHGDKDYLASVLMNHTLGGDPFDSRLGKSIRVQGGKTYGVDSGFERWRTRGELVIETATRTAETMATLKLILGEVDKLKSGGPTADELASAKANIAGGYASRFESAGDVAIALLGAELHRLGEGYVRDFPLRIDAVTLAEAKTAAAARLDPANATVVIVGNAAQVGPQLDAAGLKYEKVGYLEAVSARTRAAQKASAPAPADPAKIAPGKALLDAALAAKGGADKLRGLKDLTTKGAVVATLGGQKLEGEWTRLFVPPARLRLDMAIMGQTITMTIAPDAVFQQVGDKVRDLPRDLAEQAREGLWRDHDLILLRHLDGGTLVQDLGKTTVNKKPYDAVLVRRGDGSNETRILLDPTTHMIFRLVYTEGGAPGMEEYGDYRDVDGLKLAFKQHAEGPDQSFDVTVKEYLVNKGAAVDAFKHP